MSNSLLQSLFSPSRNIENPKASSPQYSTGADGKLYKLASEGDRNKFHILSDAEVADELRVSQEMASTLRTMNPKKPAKQKISPVKLGTASRRKKIEKRAWEKAEAEAETETNPQTHTRCDDNPLSSDPPSESPLLHSVADMQKKYTVNLTVIERLISEKVQLEEKVKAVQHELKRSKKLNRFQSAQQFKKSKTEQLVKGHETIQSVDALKSFYHQNLALIESLYAQQKTTETQLMSLQNELLGLHLSKEKGKEGVGGKTKESVLNGAASSEALLASASETNDKYLRNLSIVEQLFEERRGLVSEVKSLKTQLWGLKRSAAGGTAVQGERAAPGRVVDDEIRARLKADEEEVEEEELPVFDDDEDDEKDKDKDDEKDKDKDDDKDKKCAVLLKRSSSPALQDSRKPSGKNQNKDTYMDKIKQSEEQFVGKRKQALAREKLERVEQEAYEYELEMRRLRASKTKRKMVVINGKEKAAVVAEGMSGMAQRDTMMQQRRAEREAKRKQKEDEQNEENRKEVEREKKKVARLTKSIAASRLRDEEASRKRKEQEEGEEEHVGEDTSKERGQRVTAPKPKLTPAEITERLQRQQQAWDAKCERDKEAQRAKSVATKQDKSVEEMLLRQEQREKHLRLKHSQREEAERVEREKQLAEEAKKKERLRRRAQLNGVAAKEQAAKAKLEESQRVAGDEQTTASKQKSSISSSARGGTAGSYKNAADLIKTLTRKPKDNEPPSGASDEDGNAGEEQTKKKASDSKVDCVTGGEEDNDTGSGKGDRPGSVTGDTSSGATKGSPRDQLF